MKDQDVKLLKAIQAQDSATARTLINSGANPFAILEDGTTPFYHAYDNSQKDPNKTETLRSLVRAIANKTIRSNGEINSRLEIKQGEFQTLANLAAITGLQANLVSLLGKGASIKRLEGVQNSPLHEAIIHKQNSIIEFLISQPGYDLEDKTASGQTALFVAISHKNKEATQTLLQKGADITAKYKGKTLKDWLDDDNMEIDEDAKSLISTFTKLMPKGKKTHEKGYHDQSALAIAVCKLDVEAVKLLLDNGADIESKDFVGLTPICYPILTLMYEPQSVVDLDKYKEIIKLLAEKKPDIHFSYQKGKGQPPINLARDIVSRRRTAHTKLLEVLYETLPDLYYSVVEKIKLEEDAQRRAAEAQRQAEQLIIRKDKIQKINQNIPRLDSETLIKELEEFGPGAATEEEIMITTAYNALQKLDDNASTFQHDRARLEKLIFTLYNITRGAPQETLAGFSRDMTITGNIIAQNLVKIEVCLEQNTLFSNVIKDLVSSWKQLSPSLLQDVRKQVLNQLEDAMQIEDRIRNSQLNRSSTILTSYAFNSYQPIKGVENIAAVKERMMKKYDDLAAQIR